MASPSVLEHFEKHNCGLCSPNARHPGRIMYFPIAPGSAQSLAKYGRTKAFRASILQTIIAEKYQQPGAVTGRGEPIKAHPLNILDPLGIMGIPQTRRICASVLFCADYTSREMDVDNMAKAFLDAIKGPDRLISDDRMVIHLNAYKVVTNSIPLKLWQAAGVEKPAFHGYTALILLKLALVSEAFALD